MLKRGIVTLVTIVILSVAVFLVLQGSRTDGERAPPDAEKGSGHPIPLHAPIFEFKKRGPSTLTVSPGGSAYPGKRWISQRLQVKNVSGTDVHIYGHSLKHVHLQVYTRNSESNGGWVSQGLGYCGTGAGKAVILPGTC